MPDVVSSLIVHIGALVHEELSHCLVAVVSGDVEGREAALARHIRVPLVLKPGLGGKGDGEEGQIDASPGRDNAR